MTVEPKELTEDWIHHIGDGEHDPLEPGGEANLEDAPHHPLIQAEGLQIQMERTLVPHQGQQDKAGGDIL